MCRPVVRDKHDDVIKWKIFPRYWPFARGIHRSPVNSPHKGQWRGALMFPLICAWINVWASNREARDLRRHRAHYDVTVMYMRPILLICVQVTKTDVHTFPFPLLCFSNKSSTHECTINHGIIKPFLVVFQQNDTSISLETFSVLLALCAGNSPVTGEFPSQRPVTRSFDVFFDLRPNEWLNKQSWGWWFETPSGSLWHHCNGIKIYLITV